MRQQLAPFAATLQPAARLWWLLSLLSASLLLAVAMLPWWQGVPLLLAWLLVCHRLIGISGVGRHAVATALAVDARGVLSLCRRGQWLPLALDGASVAWPALVLLRGRAGAGSLRLLVWRGAVPDETHRALRVYVAWAHAAANSEQEIDGT